MNKLKNLATSTALQLAFFGACSLLLAHGETAPSAGIVALFVAGELGGTSLLCSTIVHRLRRGTFPAWLTEVTVGYVVSHVCILNALHLGPFGAHALHPAQNAQDWMELMLRVSLGTVVILTAGVFCKAPVRRFAEPRIRKFLAAV